MKALKDHILLYDAECPVCTLYAQTLTKNGMLDAEGREAYQQMPEAVCPYVDRQKAANEIALVNTQSGEVSYGIAGVFKVVANSFPFFGPLFTFRPFVWLMSKFYAFFSFNRRVIIPSTVKNNTAIQPAFRLGYRVGWLLFTWVMVGFVLTHYAGLLTDFVPLGNPYREYAICGGQILFQCIIVSLYAPKKNWDYLGNMMTISFGGALLLTPVILLAHFAHIWPLLFPIYFMLVAGLMFLEHIRRTKLLQLGWLLTTSWVFYRIIILLLILNLI